MLKLICTYVLCCGEATAQQFSGPLSGGKGVWNTPWELQKIKFFQVDQHRGKYFLLFSWAGRKWSGKIVKFKDAWLESYIRVVSLFSVLAVITNSLLKEEWLVQRIGADLTQPFSSCFINTLLNSCWTGKDQMTTRVKHEVKRKYVTLAWMVITLCNMHQICISDFVQPVFLLSR